MSAERSHRAMATYRQRIGEAAFADHMRILRAKRRDFGKPFRLDYVDKYGRTGSEIAAAAGSEVEKCEHRSGLDKPSGMAEDKA